MNVLLDKLAGVIQETGREISQKRSMNVSGNRWEGDQLKTKADEFAHHFLTEKLTGILPVEVVSEENPASHLEQRPEEYWLIDPIDGTRSLVDGYPGWVTQAALVKHGEVKIAAIFAPDLDLIYIAEKGCGAFCNGKQLDVSDVPIGRLLLIDNYPNPRGIAAELVEGMPCSGYIESGSIALKICRVADGTADLFVKDVPVRDWDLAAPLLILNEAGGSLTMYSGEGFSLTGNFEKTGLIAARNLLIHKQCRTFLEGI